MTRLIRLCFAALAVTIAPACAQLNGGWRHVPEVTVYAARNDDPRIALVEEAVAFWNQSLQAIGSPFRLGAIRVRLEAPPEAAVREMSELVLSGNALPSNVPAPIAALPGDLRVLLSDSDFISFAGPFDSSGRRVAVIRSAARGPLALPNVARNVIAHELGHAIGLPHHADPTALMCGRPAECRPPLFESPTPRLFPLLEVDRERLLQLYPPDWKPAAR